MRVVRWEAAALGVPGEVGQPQRAGVGDEQTEEAVTAGQVADLGPGGRIDADGDEVAEPDALGVEHAECAVVGADEGGRGLGDASQDRRQVQFGADDHDGVEQVAQLCGSGVTVRRATGRVGRGCSL